MVGTLEDVGTLEQIEVLERLDFDVPCAVPRCEHPAKWHGRPDCCSLLLIMCDRHREGVDDALRASRAYRVPAIHVGRGGCGKHTTVVIWTPLDGES